VVIGKADVVRRMPVLSRDREIILTRPQESIHDWHYLIAFWHCKRTTRAEVVLNIY
jgi:hypothetical protein